MMAEITRAAGVADAGRIRASRQPARFFTEAGVKAFHVDELEQARAWIGA
ncbi:STAS/SEC14 domain-containing protein [Burkholderia thailandensis]|nr:STAS/SEC14 domain-containing protein [Burkholderia thailandensis]